MINQYRLKQCLSYNPSDGIFRWIEKRRGLRVGDIAGYNRSDGYIDIGIDGKLYRAHRLAWLYMNGVMPKSIDHIDGDRSNNCISNLREVSKGENSKNLGTNRRNSSGEMNIMWYNPLNKWHVQIQHKGKRIHIGYFDSMVEAKAARDLARLKYGFHSNHGKRKSF